MGTFQLGVRVRKCAKLAKADPQLAAASLFVNSHQSGHRGQRARRDCAAVSIRGLLINCATALSTGAKAPQAFP